MFMYLWSSVRSLLWVNKTTREGSENLVTEGSLSLFKVKFILPGWQYAESLS